MNSDKVVSIKPASHVKEDIDYKYFREVPPIDEVAEILGIDIDKKGKFLCPSHNDTNPSAQLHLKKNCWNCWSCGSHGSPLDLVMAVQGGTVKNAAIFLNRYFPGGITNIDTQKDDPLTPPYIDHKMLEEIGIKSNPYVPKHVRGIVNMDDKKITQKQIELSLYYDEATGLILDKLREYVDSQLQYSEKILKDFPNFDDVAKQHIKEMTHSRIEKAEEYIQIFREYANKLANNTAEICCQAWDNEEEKDLA